MKKGKIIGIIVAASLAVGMTTTFAQDQPQQDSEKRGAQILNEPAGAATETIDKEKFLKEAAQSGVAEVNMAKLGTQKAQDPAVKEFAQKLVDDHSKLNDQLKECASKKGITLSTQVDSKHQQMIDHLSGLSGAEFDKAFATHMVQGHKKGIAKYKKAAESSDTEIRDLAKKALPTLQEHLKTAQQWAPEAAASGIIEEPAGAQRPEQKDEAQPQQEPQQTPDDAAPDASNNPDASKNP
jgi:putative membrane protein